MCVLALEKSGSPEVKKPAQKMIDEHGKLGQEIEQLARQLKIKLPKKSVQNIARRSTTSSISSQPSSTNASSSKTSSTTRTTRPSPSSPSPQALNTGAS
jgi:predicted outer membrane protein